MFLSSEDCTSTACTARWGTINQDVTKFCGLYSQVTSIAKSGWTDDNYLEEARELFKLEGKGRKMGREFLFEGCWRILKDAPKWKGGCAYANLGRFRQPNNTPDCVVGC